MSNSVFYSSNKVLLDALDIYAMYPSTNCTLVTWIIYSGKTSRSHVVEAEVFFIYEKIVSDI